jgi:hypothetical protein
LPIELFGLGQLALLMALEGLQEGLLERVWGHKPTVHGQGGGGNGEGVKWLSG